MKGRENMKTVVTVAALGFGFMLLACPPSFARQSRILLTPAQTRIYHKCLIEDWIEDFCRAHGWGMSDAHDRTVRECIAAEHHGRYVVNGRPPFVNMEAFCWDKAHGLVR
jgi:hypothetical protein